MNYTYSHLQNSTWEIQEAPLIFSTPFASSQSEPTLLIEQLDKFNLNLWLVVSSVLFLHVSRQIFHYYKFFTSDEIRPLWKYLNFIKHILPSFLLSLVTGVRYMGFSHLTEDVSANAALKKIHMAPGRSKLHLYYSDMHGYKDQNFIIATDTDEKIMAFRKVSMRFISERLQAGLLQRVVKEEVQEWVQKGNVDMLDLTRLLERVAFYCLYDVDPRQAFTPEEQIRRVNTFYTTTKFIVNDSYRPFGHVYGLLMYITGQNMDPRRKELLTGIKAIWDDLYARQIEMAKNGEKCLLAAFQQDPITSQLCEDFLKTNGLGAIIGGQFLTSISNITGLLFSISKGDLPSADDKINWILRLIGDWSPLSSVLRSHSEVVMKIPAIGNPNELNRPFSLGPRQCPGRGWAIEVYKCVVDEMAKYKVSAEGLENTKQTPSLWSFRNPNLKFKIEKSQI